LTNPVVRLKIKSKTTRGSVDFVLCLTQNTGFVKEPKLNAPLLIFSGLYLTGITQLIKITVLIKRQ